MSTINQQPNTSSAWVWIIASMVMYAYGTTALLMDELPQVSYFFEYISNIPSMYIALIAAFVIFVEGIYLIGSVFPGSSFTLLFAVVAGMQSPTQFILVICSIFVGWMSATVINIIYGHKMYRKAPEATSLKLSKHFWYTWFPAFRANHEVAEVARGVPRVTVFLQSLWIKLCVSIVIGLTSLALPFFIKVDEISTEEGFVGVLIIASVTLSIGIIKYLHKAPAVNTN